MHATRAESLSDSNFHPYQSLALVVAHRATNTLQTSIIGQICIEHLNIVQQVPRGYIRCDYFIVPHCIIDCDVT